MKTAEAWHFDWADNNYHDERLIEMIRAIQSDARASAIEEAAKCCDPSGIVEEDPWDDGYIAGFKRCAESIRALADDKAGAKP